jgi:hypothetical protein
MRLDPLLIFSAFLAFARHPSWRRAKLGDCRFQREFAVGSPDTGGKDNTVETPERRR